MGPKCWSKKTLIHLAHKRRGNKDRVVALYIKNVCPCSKVQKEVRGRFVQCFWVNTKAEKNSGHLRWVSIIRRKQQMESSLREASKSGGNGGLNVLVHYWKRRTLTVQLCEMC